MNTLGERNVGTAFAAGLRNIDVQDQAALADLCQRSPATSLGPLRLGIRAVMLS